MTSFRKDARGKRTRYDGVLFRSRLEARWARHFDVVGLRWSYEPLEYRCGPYTYLPDFWMRGPDCYVEIKPDEPVTGEYWMAMNLALFSNSNLFFLVGKPGEGYCLESVWYDFPSPLLNPIYDRTVTFVEQPYPSWLRLR